MNSWLENVLSIVFPSCCALCGATGTRHQYLCEPCRKSLPVNHLACTLCAAPLAQSQTGICGQCLQQPPPYRRCIAAWRYEPPLDYAVQRLKFSKDLGFARLMAELFAEQLVKFYATEDKPDVIIPVPLHVRRLRERGFNQAVEIARIISRRLRIPLDLTSCSRPKLTQPQAELPANQRKQNIKDAFAYRPAASYRHIALLDDVMTTGHTVDELTKTVQKVSMCTIDVWICARASR